MAGTLWGVRCGRESCRVVSVENEVWRRRGLAERVDGFELVLRGDVKGQEGAIGGSEGKSWRRSMCGTTRKEQPRGAWGYHVRAWPSVDWSVYNSLTPHFRFHVYMSLASLHSLIFALFNQLSLRSWFHQTPRLHSSRCTACTQHFAVDASFELNPMDAARYPIQARQSPEQPMLA